MKDDIARENFLLGEAFMLHKVKKLFHSCEDPHQLTARLFRFLNEEEERNERASRKHHPSETI